MCGCTVRRKSFLRATWFAGSFFFSRYAPASGRSTAEFLFSTISSGISFTIPVAGKIIDAVVAHDPSIPTKAREIQLQKLITATSFGGIKATNRYHYRWARRM
jgi:hypothetical protein